MKWLNRSAVLILVASLLGIGVRMVDLNLSRHAVEETREIYAGAAVVGATGELSGSAASSDKMPIAASSEAVESKTSEVMASKLRIKELAAINEDIIGWLQVEGTAIDYPVVLGYDNDYYLNHGYDGKKSIAGAIFMDYRNKTFGMDRHIILYGHNMKDGTMFKGLMSYKNGDFFKKNRIILIETSDGVEFWQVYSAYITSTDFYYIRTAFENELDFRRFVRITAQKSMHGVDGTVEGVDRILTLSTCSYEFENAMFVVHARPAESNGFKGTQ